MYILMILVVAVMFSFQFIFNDSFRKEEGSSLSSALKFTLYTSVFGLIVLFALIRHTYRFLCFLS